MNALVTGAAGFIGSHLAEALVAQGNRVVGVDCFTPYYDEAQKRENLSPLLLDRNFDLIETDLRSADLLGMLSGIDSVFHQAAQPGVRLSWSEGFNDYNQLNVLVTQRLLEAAKIAGVNKFVFASSSSVYGNAPRYPTTERDLPQPNSPYGTTKLAAEHLCSLYASNWGVPTISLRYFTVYGPRQRPDMALHRIFEAGITGAPFPLLGDGSQIRDFTFVSDIVAANIASTIADVPPGTVLNIASSNPIQMCELLELSGQVLGRPIPIAQYPTQPGDVDRTGGAIDAAVDMLGWVPSVELTAGLEAQVEWHRERHPC